MQTQTLNSSSAVYHIRLFGGLSATDHGGATIAQFRTRKTALLLSYLALYAERKHAREELVEQFCPDLSPDAARDNLSGYLTTLRRHFGNTRNHDAPPALLANRDTVWLNLPAVEVDVVTFHHLLGSARAAAPPRRIELLEAAIALYRGPLLVGVYEDWALSERERLSEQFNQALIELAEAQHATGVWATALSTALRAQELDPYHEAPRRLRMRILAEQNRVPAARDVFHEFAQFLKQQLDTRPSAALRQFYQELDRQDVAPLPELTPKPAPLASTTVTTVRAVQPDAARLWGRDAELAQLITLLQEARQTRLITVTGTGGIGKTSLTRATLAAALPDDVLLARRFVSLAETEAVSQVVPRIAHTLGAQTSGGEDTLEAVIAALAPSAPQQRVLLALDNLEQLLPRARDVDSASPEDLSLTALLGLLLYRMPHLVLLCTSRRALGITGEQEFPLRPLEESPATALFLERLERVRPGMPHDTGMVREIVRRVDGIPLALEMIAGWSRVLTVTQIAQRLGASDADAHGKPLDLLVNRARDVPRRHENLRRTLNGSLEMLDPAVQAIFEELSVFHGGWRVEAAEAVLGMDALFALQELAEHSLVVRAFASEHGTLTDRLRFLEPVRELARERLHQRERSRYEEVLQRHAEHFTRFIAEIEAALEADIETAMNRYKEEEANCRAAANWLIQSAAVGKTRSDAVLAVVLPFSNILAKSGNQRFAFDLIRRVLAVVPGIDPQTRVELLHRQIYCCWPLNRHAEIAPLLDAAEQEAVRAGSRKSLARVRATRGNYYHSIGKIEEAIRTTEQVMADFPDIYGEDGDSYVRILSNLGAFLNDTDQHERAIAVLERTVRAARAAKYWGALEVALANLADKHATLGDFSAAFVYAQEALSIAVQTERGGATLTYLFLLAALAISTGDREKGARLEAAARTIAEADARRREVPLSAYHYLEFFLYRNADWRARFTLSQLRLLETQGQAMTMEDAIAYAQGKETFASA